MTHLILHGGYLAKFRNELNDGFYRRVCDLLPDGGTILCVYFARPVENRADRFVQEQERILEQARGKQLTIICATEDGFVAEVKRADAVLIGGGMPMPLMAFLSKYPNLREMFKDKVVAGSSSGAYALSTYYYSLVPTPGVYQGLGLVPVRVICHYQSDTEEYVGDEALEASKAYPSDLELVVLKDFEWREWSIDL